MKITKEQYQQLAAAFPDNTIERTRGSQTHKGYDTTGIKYQYVVNRLNEVLGVGCFTIDRNFRTIEGQTKRGQSFYETTCDIIMRLGEWQDGKFIACAEACGTGGHKAFTIADAEKGSFTNGFKKTAAMFGVGWQAYAGSIDDDNIPYPNGQPAPQTTQQKPAQKLNVGQLVEQIKEETNPEFYEMLKTSYQMNRNKKPETIAVFTKALQTLVGKESFPANMPCPHGMDADRWSIVWNELAERMSIIKE